MLGASGYAGAELLRLLIGHPFVRVAFLGAHDSAGHTVGEVFPYLAPITDDTLQRIESFEPGATPFILCALPPGMAAQLVPASLEAGSRVIDLSGDFRLSADEYPRWYGFEHPAPAWLEKAAYGLTELRRNDIAGAALVANPGCYPTPVILGLAPLLTGGLVAPAPIIVDGKSGISGAGKKPTAQSHFASLDGSVQPYRIGKHQHGPEMEAALTRGGAGDVSITFVPHLVPSVRGIVTTAYATAAPGIGPGDLNEALARAYEGEPFVRVVPVGSVPDPKRLTGSNVCEVGVGFDTHTQTAVVVGAVDNLGKGAAGQAVQNLNAMMGWPETTGLSTVGVYP
ncbi:MAG: N-acetyl-gamma-glutamyl-phosphate reductase [Actinomycetota bacterium]